jgi:hypothetical protein
VQLGRVECDRVAGRLGQPGVLLGREQPQRELGAARGDAGLLAVGVDLDGPGRQRPDDVGDQAGGQHADAVGTPVDALADVDGDGQLEVVPCQCEDVTGELRPYPCQDRQGTAAAGGGSAGGAERFDENVSLASELHAVPLSLPSFLISGQG